MKISKEKRSKIITLVIFILIIIIATLSFTIKPKNHTNQELAKCIGERSTLYLQLGCSHCEDQKNLFGENYQYLNVVDCFYDPQECTNNNIEATPTWKIKGNLYKGFQTIEELKSLTEC